MPVEEIRWDKQDIVKCDERGRATLGSEYSNEQVYVYIAETPEVDAMEEPESEKKAMLGDLVSWAEEEGIDWIDVNPVSGTVVDKNGEEHDAPF